MMKIYQFLVDRDPIPAVALCVGGSSVQLFAVTSFLK